MTINSTRRGFTLIELLVVVLIIGILAAVALPQYQYAILKSQYAQLITAGEAIYKAEQLYFLANGKYTSSFSDLDLSIPTDTNTYTCLLFPQDAYCRLKIKGQQLGYHISHTGVRRCLIGTYFDPQKLSSFCAKLTGQTGTRFGDSLSFLFPRK